MRRNDMRAQGVRALLPTFRASPHLRLLDLGMNGLGNSGARLLAPLLLCLTALAHLDLSGNAIEADGAEALAEHLQHCSALTLLDLGHNDMRADGVAHLALALPHCHLLAHFDVSNNRRATSQLACHPLTNTTKTNTHQPTPTRCANLDALAEALFACPALATLNVSYNSLCQHGVQSLACLLSTATALRALHMHMCVRGSYSHSLPAGLGLCSGAPLVLLLRHLCMC